MTPGASTAVVAAAGLAAGSFLNVCVHRLPRGESIVRPASHCPACGRLVRWLDNVPVASYLMLGGRCRACHTRISVMYPAVEIVTAALFVLQYQQFGWQPLLVARLIFACAMLALFVIDLQHRILPNVITLPGIAAGVLFSLFLPPGWRGSLAGVALGGGVLYAVAELYYRVRGEEGLGMGDVKMLAMIGAFLGWQLGLLALVLSSLAGSLVGLALIATKKGNLKYALPFGSFLAVGALAAGTAGQTIIAWYLSLY